VRTLTVGIGIEIVHQEPIPARKIAQSADVNGTSGRRMADLSPPKPARVISLMSARFLGRIRRACGGVLGI